MSFRTGLRLAAAPTALALSIALGVPLPAQAAAPLGYRLVKSIPLGTPDRWDYVVYDPASSRVFVAHADRVTVVDGRADRVIGEIGGLPGGSHGTAISVATGQGFTDDGRAGQVLAFDLKTLEPVKRIPAAADADGIVTDPATGDVFVADGDSGQVTAIDPRTDRAIAEIALGGKLEGLDADRRGHVFVAGAEKRELVVIGTRSNRILARHAIPACVSPHGVAVDDAGGRVFVTCENALMLVLDADTGAIVTTVPIGRGSDAAAWDPKHRRAFSPNGKDGTISVVQQITPNAYKVLPAVATRPSARTMAVDPDTGRLFVAAADLAPASQTGARRSVRPGSLELLVFEPTKSPRP